MSDRMIRAAGGVLWRPHGATIDVAVVHRPRYDDWSLPKGKAARDEHPLSTACREVLEETGFRPVIGPRLPSQRYRSPGGPKVVHYWAMTGDDGGFSPTTEVDRLAWLPVGQARAVLTYPRDVTVLDAFTRVAAVDAVTLLVRHGGAHDAAAPNRRGLRQAEALCRVLPSFAPSRLLCVPDPACRDSLTALARRLRLSVTPEPVLEHRHCGGPSWVRQLMGPGGTTLACVRGRVVRDAIAALAGDGPAAPARIRAKKASVWALFFHGGRLAVADYYPSLLVGG
jgi:8-oxo-dGTP pyrophosphatase MutT (NUDIX family)